MKKKIHLFFITLLFIFYSGLFAESDIFFKEGLKYYKKKEYSPAIEKFKKSLEKNSEIPVTHYYLGNSYYQLKNYEKSLPHLNSFFFKDSYKNYSLINDAFRKIVNIYKRKKMWDEIIKTGNSYLTKIRGLKKFKRYAASTHRTIGDSYRRKGDIFFRKKDYEKALINYIKAIEHKPSDPWILEKTGRSYYQVGKIEEAKKYFLESIINSGKSWHLKLSSILFITELVEIKEEFKKIKEKIKNDEISMKIISACENWERQNYSSAFDVIKELEEKLNTNGEFAFRFGRNFVFKKEVSPEFYLFLIKEFPDHRSTNWVIKSIIQNYRRDKEKTQKIKENIEQILKEIVNKSPREIKSQYAFLHLVDLKFTGVEETEKNYEEKIEMYEEFKKKFPGENKLLMAVFKKEASIYAEKLENYEEAIKIYSKLLKDKKDLSLLPELAECYSKTGNYEKSISLLREYLDKKNTDVNRKIQLAQYLLQYEKIEEGIGILEKLEETSDRRIKKRISKILEEYEKLNSEEYKLEEDKKITLFLNVTNQNYFFTNYKNLDENSSVIFSKRNEIKIFPFSEEKTKYPFQLKMYAPQKPALSQPYTLILPHKDKFLCRWDEEIQSSKESWRKRISYKLISPWEDWHCKDIKVERLFDSDEERKSAIILLKVKTSSPEWQIRIFLSSRIGEIQEIEPKPEKITSTRILVYSKINTDDKNKTFEIKIKANLPKNILTYYPKIILSKKTGNKTIEARNVKEIKFRDNSGVFHHLHSIPETYFKTILVEQETLYELEEKFN